MATKSMMEIMEASTKAVNKQLTAQANTNKANDISTIGAVSLVAGFRSEFLYKPNDVMENLYNNRETFTNNPAVNVTPPQFGVLGHIDPSRVFLFDAIKSISNLREQLVGVGNIANKVDDLFSEIKEKNKNEALGIFDDQLDPLRWRNYNKTNALLFSIDYEFEVMEGTQKKIEKRSKITKLENLDDDSNHISSVYSTALFSTANSYKKEIREIDQLHNQLMNLQNQLSHALIRKKNQLVKLDAEIPVLQRNLANLNQERIKAQGEYQMVLALVAEDWQRVNQEYARRERILTNHSGLYFVRVMETPYARTSLVDRDLRYGRIEDLVPATAISQDELPEDLEDYIETIVDIPIANWKNFNGSWNYLPSRNTIIKLMEQRKLRLTYLSQKTRKASSSKFVPMLQIHQAILQDYARFEFLHEASLQAFYQRAVNVISLEDLLTGTPHQLRTKAQNFRNQLDQATHALLTKLHNIKPGIRLEWATRAELDQLDLRDPYSWPGLKDEQQEDIGNVRSMIELINWWWRQLNDNASSASVTAVRNLLRAALMVAVGDDPKEMIHGYLQVIPGQFRAGDLLRAKLNRHAPIGTFLQLVNGNNQLIGKLRVEDADENGTVVSVAQVLHQEKIESTSQFSVIGIKTTGRSFV